MTIKSVPRNFKLSEEAFSVVSVEIKVKYFQW
jgi:hypothetical protein